jgi:hypothetical protein
MAVALLAAALACAALLAAPQRAAAAPTAAQIDTFLAAQGSPMAGMGATFVADGRQYGVDPAFLVAITGAETGFGRLIYQEGGDYCTFNAWNWFWGPTRPQSDFTSWADGCDHVAAGLAGTLYYGAGRYAVLDIALVYCPDGTQAWINNVSTFMLQLGGNPSDTRWLAPSAPTGPAALDLGSAVTLSKGPYYTGQTLKATFALTNTGGQGATWDAITMHVRGPGEIPYDLGSSKPFTLQPGESWAFTAPWSLAQKGSWYGWIEVQKGGVWTHVGKSPAFEITVADPPAGSLSASPAPWDARADKNLVVGGVLRPAYQATGRSIKVTYYFRFHQTWVHIGTVTAKVRQWSQRATYRAALALTHPGQWRLRAWAPPQGGRAAVWSAWRSVTVR